MANSNVRSAGDEQVRRDGQVLPADVREPQQAAKSTGPVEEQALPQLMAEAQGLLAPDAGPDAPVTSLPEGLFDPVSAFTRRNVYAAYHL